jgi:diguanylate cyclase (GGDEF)-like protein
MEINNNKVTRSSITLSSWHTKVIQLQLTLKALIAIAVLLLINELFINHFSALALAMSLSIIMFTLFLLWASADTYSVISGMMLWSVAVIITYACWIGNGIFDTSILAFPCLLMLAAILSGKLIFASIFAYLISALCFFAFAHNQGLLAGAQLFETLPLLGRMVGSIIMLVLFSVGIFLVFADIKKRFKNVLDKNASLELSISRLKKRSGYDPLTRLPNENVCKVDLDNILKQQKLSRHTLAFITLNISNQDSIKMNYSHSVCNKALKLLANKLTDYTNDKTVIYRFQQNQFVILRNSPNHRGINQFAEKLYQVCSQTFHVEHFDIVFNPVIGIALAPFDGSSMEELRHNSYLAMHTKDEGNKAHLSFFDQVMATKEQATLQLTKSLKNSIVNNEFVLHFQPKVDLETGQIIGAEALIRWNSPEHGFIPPTVFIPLAEQVGVISDITLWVIENSINACKYWHKLGFNKLCVAVNLSAADFKRGNLSTYTMSTLHQAKLSAHFLELELTESMVMEDINHIQKQINELCAFGIAFSIDDFGTGYSNLGYLTKFNVSSIKLDRSFVMNIRHSSNELQIVKAIIEMSKSLNITNIAEGIEDIATAKLLTQLGCEVGQGYLWSKPLPQEEFIALLSDENKVSITSLEPVTISV